MCPSRKSTSTQENVPHWSVQMAFVILLTGIGAAITGLTGAATLATLTTFVVAVSRLVLRR
jgi:hypothetical protein